MFLSILSVKLTTINTVNKPNISPNNGNVKLLRNGIVKPERITMPAPTEAPDDTPKV